jgi:hypothetical protein
MVELTLVRSLDERLLDDLPPPKRRVHARSVASVGTTATREGGRIVDKRRGVAEHQVVTLGLSVDTASSGPIRWIAEKEPHLLQRPTVIDYVCDRP